MLNVIYHKSFKETGEKRCIPDDLYNQMLDYVEWFNSPDLVDRSETLNKTCKKKELVEVEEEITEKVEEVKKRGRPRIKQE